jgi:hypothetical protein
MWFGEVPERLNGRDWKSRNGGNLVRGFESLPLRCSARFGYLKRDLALRFRPVKAGRAVVCARARPRPFVRSDCEYGESLSEQRTHVTGISGGDCVAAAAHADRDAGIDHVGARCRPP